MRGLWGEVSPTLRAASIKSENRTIHLFFFYDGKISEEDHESAECVATEVIADFPYHKFAIDIKRLDYPARIPQDIGELVYRRREKNPAYYGFLGLWRRLRDFVIEKLK